MDIERDPDTVDADEAIRQTYEESNQTGIEADREDATEPVSTADQLAGRRERSEDPLADLSGGDVDAAAQDLDAGIETPGGSNPTPDQDQVDEIGASVGVTYQDDEPLKFGDKMAGRDDRRWELNPASSEDYQQRQQEAPGSPEQSRQRRPSDKKTIRRDAPKPSSKRRPERNTTRRPKKATKTTRSGKSATTRAKRAKRSTQSRKQATRMGLKRSGADVPRKRSSKPGSRSIRKKSGKRTRS